jgi:hypothetical protein
VQSPAGPADVLADLADILGSLHVPWYLFGAQAALIWGRPRLTTDIDITVGAIPGGAPALLAALRSRGFAVRIVATPGFVRQTRVLPVVHIPSGFAIDIVLAGPGIEEEFLARAVPTDVGGVTVPVISPEDLIVTKVLAGRSKDIDDIRGVLAERGDQLDLARVRNVLRMLEDALGQSDLLPVFEAELTRSQRTRPSPE